ncbi:MAG: diguanylate cyclase [Spirochaetaceae bacterium]|nr:diguanylate cyclase [Spirochaetaceae bacterium]MDT8296924.1 diguanylate cyclase [Spirochaetaceae bacterium]
MKKGKSLVFRLLGVFFSVGILYFLVITVLDIVVMQPTLKKIDAAAAMNRHDGVLDIIEGELDSLRVISQGFSATMMRENQLISDAAVADLMNAFEIDILALPTEKQNPRLSSGRLRENGQIVELPENLGILPASKTAVPWTFLSLEDGNDIYTAVIGNVIIARRIGYRLRTGDSSPDGSTIRLSITEEQEVSDISAMDKDGRIIFEKVSPNTILIDRTAAGVVSTTFISPGRDSRGLTISLESPSFIEDVGSAGFCRIVAMNAALFILVLIAVLIWSIRRVSRPMMRLITGINEWDGLRLPDFGVLTERQDELGILAKSFIRMSGEVRSKTRSLEEQAIRDGLTGLLNRRRFDENLGNEWNRSHREQESLSLVMVDIDDFKAYNDTYGHQEGDECLRLVAQACGSAALRPGDLPFRYGGEEFALILSETDAEGAALVAERIRIAIENLNIEHSANPREGKVTASFGVATADSNNRMTKEELLRSADEALYRAKQTGRNRVVSN